MFQFLPLLFLLITTLDQSVNATTCGIYYHHVIGIRNIIVSTCDCPIENGPNLGRAEIDFFPTKQVSTRQFRAMIHCFDRERRKRNLIATCRNRPQLFEKRMLALLSYCKHRVRGVKARGTKQPFIYNSSKCVSYFSERVDANNIAGVFVCRCKQTQFNLHPRKPFPFVTTGRAEFFTRNAPTGARKELTTLKKCVSSMASQMNGVCRNSPGDFEVLALHMLQVCCKRARFLTLTGKFECSTIVPDNLDGLKFTN